MCLGVESFALVLNVEFKTLGCQRMRWLGVFIAPNHFLAVGKVCWRWPHRTVTIHCPVRATSACPLGFGAVDPWSHLSFCSTGQSGATPDSPMTFDFCTLTSVAALFITVHLRSRPLARRELLLRWLTGQFGGTLDSPVNYSGAHLEETREWLVRCLPGLVHRTMSGAPLGSTLSVLFQI
jgi:hypothetical protein